MVLLMTTICSAQINFKTIQKDFYKLSGYWQGSLTYLDYSSGKPYTMPADIEIKRMGKSNKFILSNIYPNEKSANSIDTLSISTDGKYIDNEMIQSRRKLHSGDIEIITEAQGKDGNDNKPATFRHTYILGKTIFKKKKEVQFEGEKEWIKRHEYSYTRKLAD
ncbi:MAG: hypothetical protein EAZ67_02970 [Cytophagales bacterium]|nr:MAG: hypothetical protein EAZ67_02970 [Cytophagales bacterium]